MTDQTKKQFYDMKAAIHAAFKRQEAAYSEAQLLTLPAEPLAELALFEAEALAWEDHKDLPQKKAILENIRRARLAYDKNDIAELKLEYFIMLKNRENAISDIWTIKKEKDETASRTGGAKGGSASKYKEWAHVAACLLVEDTEGMGFTADQAFEHMPDGYTFEEFEWNDYHCEVYRDGEKLCCVATIEESQNKNDDTSKKVKKINLGVLKKSSFLRNYYRPAKNSGK